MAGGEFLQVDHDILGQVGGQAAHVDLVHDVAHDRAAGLHRRGQLGIDEVQRDLHVHLLIRQHALEVDVLHFGLPRMHVDRAQEHLLLGAVERQIEDRGVELLRTQLMEQRVVLEFDIHRFGASAVHDARHFTAEAQAAARTRALLFALLRNDFDTHLGVPFEIALSATRQRVDEAILLFDGSAIRLFDYSMKRELTESSLDMRRMVSAMRPATDSTRIFLQACASGRSGMVSVTTTSSSSDSEIRCTAWPESTGWVQ